VICVVLIAYDADEQAILTHALQRVGMVVQVQHQTGDFLEWWPEHAADLIVLALPFDELIRNLPSIRARATVPIIALVDSVNESECISLYGAGANLVIVRPYSTRLLVAQVSALAKHSQGLPRLRPSKPQPDDVWVEPSTHMVRIVGNPAVMLTGREFQLFLFLFNHRGQTLSSEQIIEAIWGYTGQGDKNMLRSLVYRLRSKIEPTPHQPQYIVSAPGIGYRFQPAAPATMLRAQLDLVYGCINGSRR